MQERMSNEEYLTLKKRLLKDEEKKLQRYSKLIDSYNKKYKQQVVWCNRYVGEIAELEDKIRMEKKGASNGKI